MIRHHCLPCSHYAIPWTLSLSSKPLPTCPSDRTSTTTEVSTHVYILFDSLTRKVYARKMVTVNIELFRCFFITCHRVFLC